MEKQAKELFSSKTALAKSLGVSRSTLYYQPKQPQKDWHLKNRIEMVLTNHPSYGYRRVALELKLNPKPVQRVMRVYGLKPYRRRGRKYRKSKANGQIYPNLLQQLEFPESQGKIWVSDFTHLTFKGKFVYLATLMDIYDRTIVGWTILTSHPVQLTISALIDAIEKYGRPEILHSDQGSEYKSKVYTSFVKSLGIKQSMSSKASPWQNGYQESFYSGFKTDFGDPDRFQSLGELTAAIYLQIHYYNTKRIHSKLKMPPRVYSKRQEDLNINHIPVRL